MGLTAWTELLRRAGCEAPPVDIRAAHTDLLDRWSQPHRHYHNLVHLGAVLDHIDRLGGSESAHLAGWFHDAVYDPRRQDNEAASAALASAVLGELGLQPTMVEPVTRLVLMTRSHEPDPGDTDGLVLADADLAILATPPDTYDSYASGIRREYSHVRGSDFRRGRSAVLRALLHRERIYCTAYGQAHWEGPARANLERELSRLADGPTPT